MMKNDNNQMKNRDMFIVFAKNLEFAISFLASIRTL